MANSAAITDRRGGQYSPKLHRLMVTPEGVGLNVYIANAGARAGAVVLDIVFIAMIMFAYVIILGIIISTFDINDNSSFGAFLLVVSIIFIFMLRNAYFLFFELGSKSATWGKRILGLRVASRDGGRLTKEAVIARNLVREIELFLPISYLITTSVQGGLSNYAVIAGLIWICIFLFFPLFNKDRLRCGDVIAGTWVVHAEKAKMTNIVASADSVNNQLSAQYRFTDEELDIYGEYELKTLEKVLREESSDAERAVYEAICRKLDWVPGSGDERAFLENYYTQLRARLEGDMRFGKRRADKFDRVNKS